MSLNKGALACVLVGVSVLRGPAQAASVPQVGPVPAWVHSAPLVPVEKADAKSLPVAILLNDTQFSFDADGWTEYHEVQARIQTPAGLQAVGAIPFKWSPWSDTLTFHRASIIRDGQTIDVLPKDGAFTVLRRETGLAQATLTGELTALLQPDGLQVGDLLEVTVSVRHAAPLLKGRPSALFAGWDIAPIGRFRVEARWPSSLPVRWRQTAGLPALTQSKVGGETSVSLTADDIRPPILPAHAPVRFQHGQQFEFTTFPDWNAVAQIMAPLYAKAAQLAPQSPVTAQAKLIATATADPKERAAGALRLVQGQVRYLAHVEADGGYTPQSADDTWRLRYGDCKAKTALLLALLRELGVPAEPVLVNTTGGDGLEQHLPALLFDHVLVRVTLNGRDYWLDGAREGDRTLDELTTPAYGWVLPLGSTDAKLIHIRAAPAAQPQLLQVIRYDASGGVTAPEPTQLKTIFRGDAAILIHTTLTAVPADRLDAALKTYWAGVHTAFTATHVGAAWDPATGEQTLTAGGTSKLDWSGSGLELQHVALGGAPDIKRDPRSNDLDAPYLVDFPTYVETDESVVLPPGDKPSLSTAKAVAVDSVIAGIAYHRSATVSGDVFSVVASQRSLQPEISTAQARDSVDALTKLGNQGVYAPAGSQTQAADDAAALDSQPTTADGHIRRGNALLDAWRLKDATAEFDAAIALDPNAQMAWAGRAITKAWLFDPTADADADKAGHLGKPEIVAARARGVLAANRGDLEGARAAFSHALILAPNDEFTLEHLIDVDLRRAKLEDARRDLADLVKNHPEIGPRTYLLGAEIERVAHHKAAAEQDLAQAPASSAEQRLTRARLYLQLDDKDLARADIDAAIRLKPSAAAWLLRANADGGFSSKTAQADVDAALKLEPENLDAQLWRVNAANARQDYAAALLLINPVISEHPDIAGNLLVGRAKIENQLGHKTEVDADFMRARTLIGSAAPEAAELCNGEVGSEWRADVAVSDCAKAVEKAPSDPGLRLDEIILLHSLGRETEIDKMLADMEALKPDADKLNNLCYSLAVKAIRLEKALSYCDASLKLRPNNSATLDSRGFALMRLGREEDAIAAYDAALAVNPTEYHSLYGRSLAEERLGRKADGKRDLAAAIALRPHIAEEFAKIGLK